MTVTLTLGALSTCLESLNSRGGQHPFVRPACGEAPMNKLSMCVHTYVQLSLRPLWTVALEAPLSMGFPRQEYWNGLPFPPPGDLPNPGIKLMSPVSPALQADSLPTEL